MSGKTGTKQDEAWGDDLTAKQRAFCREYLVDLNATQAAIRAGYSENSATEIGFENLSKPHIHREVQRMMNERAERVEVTADMVLRELIGIATVDLSEAFDEFGALKPIKDIPKNVRKAIAGIETLQIGDGAGTVKKVRFWDKNKSLEMLGRHLKLFVDKVEHTGKDGAPLMEGRSEEDMVKFAALMADAKAKVEG